MHNTSNINNKLSLIAFEVVVVVVSLQRCPMRQPVICVQCERPCKPGTEAIYVDGKGIHYGLCSKRCQKKYNGSEEEEDARS